MANEIRIRRNNISGSLSSGITNVATTISSPGFVDLPTVDATSHMIVVIDPLEIAGPAEIVRVTAHAAASADVTVIRGVEGSSPRSHLLGTTWFHGPIVSDWVDVVTSGTRPAIPYEGQFIYETDTNKLVGFGGVDWASRDAGGYLGHTFNAGAVAVVGAGPTDLCSVSVTVGAGRRIKITGYGSCGSTTATDVVRLKINEGATVLNLGDIVPGAGIGVTGNIALNVWTIETPSAGLHTYKLVGERVAGAGTITYSSNLGFKFLTGILVEDIGAV